MEGIGPPSSLGRPLARISLEGAPAIKMLKPKRASVAHKRYKPYVKNAAVHPKRQPINRRTHEPPSPKKPEGGPTTQSKMANGLKQFSSPRKENSSRHPNGLSEPTYDPKSCLFAQEIHSAEGERPIARTNSNPGRDSHFSISSQGFPVFLSPIRDCIFLSGTQRADFIFFPPNSPIVFTLAAYFPGISSGKGGGRKKKISD